MPVVRISGAQAEWRPRRGVRSGKSPTDVFRTRHVQKQTNPFWKDNNQSKAWCKSFSLGKELTFNLIHRVNQQEKSVQKTPAWKISKLLKGKMLLFTNILFGSDAVFENHQWFCFAKITQQVSWGQVLTYHLLVYKVVWGTSCTKA